MYQLRASSFTIKRGITSFKVNLRMVVDACAPTSVGNIEATFYPLGRQVPSCTKQTSPIALMVMANPRKCARAATGKHNATTSKHY